ncbi:MAG: VOC family protein [Actinobacteria bacterium]|nr:VOC family protein [Actinomycetota bacterium]
MSETTKLKTFLWFPGNMDEALAFYQSIFTDFKIHSENRPDPDKARFTADFSIYRHNFIGMNWPGGDSFNNAISLSLNVDGQDEVDRLWEAITLKGKSGRCGWCTDEFGLTWQVSPIQMREHLENPDREKAEYANKALQQMTRIIISDLYEG